MSKFRDGFRMTSDFLRQNWSVVAVILFGIWWLAPQNPEKFTTNLAETKMAFDEAPQAVMAKSIARDFAPPVQKGGFAPESDDRKIVKTAQLNLESDDTEATKDRARSKIRDFGGFITHQNSWEVRPGTLAYRMTARIPAEKLNLAIAELEKLGTKRSESFSSSDITAQYRDTEALIANLRVRRDRLRKMLDRETKNLSDVLQVDRELSNVQLQIENLERLQKSRSDRASFSTLTLSITPEPEIGDFSSPEWSPKKSWRVAVNDFLQSSRKIFDAVVKIVVFSPIWLPILLFLIFLRRQFRKNDS